MKDAQQNYFRWERDNMACTWMPALYAHDNPPSKPRKGDEHLYGQIFMVSPTMDLNMCISMYPAPIAS